MKLIKYVRDYSERGLKLLTDSDKELARAWVGDWKRTHKRHVCVELNAGANEDDENTVDCLLIFFGPAVGVEVRNRWLTRKVRALLPELPTVIRDAVTYGVRMTFLDPDMGAFWFSADIGTPTNEWCSSWSQQWRQIRFDFDGWFWRYQGKDSEPWEGVEITLPEGVYYWRARRETRRWKSRIGTTKQATTYNFEPGQNEAIPTDHKGPLCGMSVSADSKPEAIAHVLLRVYQRRGGIVENRMEGKYARAEN